MIKTQTLEIGQEIIGATLVDEAAFLNNHWIACIDACYIDQNGQTIYHVIAAYNFAYSFQSLISAEDSIKGIAQIKVEKFCLVFCLGLGVVSFSCQFKNFLFCLSLFFFFFAFFECSFWTEQSPID